MAAPSLATPFLVPVILPSSGTQGVSTVLLMALAALLASYQLLKGATQEPLHLTINKDIVEHHTPGWKEHLHIKLKVGTAQNNLCMWQPRHGSLVPKK
jgi:hypothetical protein